MDGSELIDAAHGVAVGRELDVELEHGIDSEGEELQRPTLLDSPRDCTTASIQIEIQKRET